MVDLPSAHVIVKMHSVVDETSTDKFGVAVMASAEVDFALQQAYRRSHRSRDTRP